jgi:hypothetical protein
VGTWQTYYRYYCPRLWTAYTVCTSMNYLHVASFKRSQ